MAKNLYIDQKLESPTMRDLLAKRKSTDPSDKQAINEVMGNLIYEIVMQARFLASVTFSRELAYDIDGTRILAPESDITFTMLNNTNGEHYFPVFSENAEMDKWENAKIEHTIHVNFDNLAVMIENNKNCGGFVINPFSDNMTVSRDIVSKWFEKKQMLQNGHAQHVITPDSQYEFHTLNPYPMLLSNKLCEEAKALTVNAMWLRGVTLNGDNGYLLVVDFDGERASVFEQLGNSAKQFLAGKSLHIVDAKENFGKLAVENVIPIYSKE